MSPTQGTQPEQDSAVTLHPAQRSAWLDNVARRWKTQLVGQPQASEVILRLLQRVEVGATQPQRPMGSVLLLGPPGCGKTHAVETLAEVLAGSVEALVKINCAEFQQPHEIARLIGAPPGYIGHADTEPIFTRERLECHRTAEFPYTLVLFDEIEKAHASLHALLLGVLDRAELFDGRNRRVDFRACLFFFTSNLGSREGLSGADHSGFVPAVAGSDARASHFQSTALRALKRYFPPEFLRRLEETIVFQPLRPADLAGILNLELGKLARMFRHHATHPFDVRFSPSAKSMLLKQGRPIEYGASHLHQTLSREVLDPLYRLMATGQVRPREAVWVSAEAGALRFQKG